MESEQEWAHKYLSMAVNYDKFDDSALKLVDMMACYRLAVNT